MAPINDLRFSLNDRIHEVEVGPGHVPLSLLGEFQKDVSDFLKGAGREVDPAEVVVAVEEGSLTLAAVGLAAATTLWADLELLRHPDALSLIDPRRAAVIERWQAAARSNPHRRYRVADATARVNLGVDAASDFRRAEETWVAVEKYVHGRVVDWGGKTRANVHLELADGVTLIVAAPQELIAREEQNLVYRDALLHITAEESLLTGALRNPRLLAFAAHQPAYDEAEFQRMVQQGSAAWSGVPDAAEWLEKLRAGA